MIWLENLNGDASNWLEHPEISGVSYSSVIKVSMADINMDGHWDLLPVISMGTSFLAYCINNGASVPSFDCFIAASTMAGVIHYVGADLDLDGDGDLVAVEWDIADEYDTLPWWQNNNDDWTRHDITVTGPISPQFVLTDDMDQDGDYDLVAVTGTGVNWFENDCI